jgi:hypothetical protein
VNEPRNERDAWRARYEHEIIREFPVERRVIVLDPEETELDPVTHEQVHQGDFATGLETLPRHPEVELPGRFARGQQMTDPGNPNEERLAS